MKSIALGAARAVVKTASLGGQEVPPSPAPLAAPSSLEEVDESQMSDSMEESGGTGGSGELLPRTMSSLSSFYQSRSRGSSGNLHDPLVPSSPSSVASLGTHLGLSSPLVGEVVSEEAGDTEDGEAKSGEGEAGETVDGDSMGGDDVNSAAPRICLVTQGEGFPSCCLRCAVGPASFMS